MMHGIRPLCWFHPCRRLSRFFAGCTRGGSAWPDRSPDAFACLYGALSRDSRRLILFGQAAWEIRVRLPPRPKTAAVVVYLEIVRTVHPEMLAIVRRQTAAFVHPGIAETAHPFVAARFAYAFCKSPGPTGLGCGSGRDPEQPAPRCGGRCVLGRRPPCSFPAPLRAQQRRLQSLHCHAR
jgi:hypothetical protein